MCFDVARHLNAYTEIVKIFGLKVCDIRKTVEYFKMWYHYSLVLLMFAVDIGELYESHRVLVEPKSPICVKQGRHSTVSCILHFNLSSVNFTRPFTNWSLIWYQNGLQLTNATIIHHANSSIASEFVAKGPGLFTCVAKRSLSPQSSENRSVSIGMAPKPVTSLVGTPRFSSDEDGFRYVMVSWFRQGLKYVYSLFFKINLDLCFPSTCLEGNIEPTCNGTKCTALIYTEGYDMSELTFYIVTRQGECGSRSKVWEYNLTLTSCGVLPPKTLFYIPIPPTNLEIETSYRRVTIKWQDILFWLPPTVLFTYTCLKTPLNVTIRLKGLDIRKIRLSDKDIRGYAPYEQCTFCLAIQEYRCGQFSKPLCNTTNLHEEPPSEAPTITCTYDTCPTTYDGQFRNLTVTWELPAEKYWGGILREIKLRYWQTSSNATWQEIIVRNLSRNGVAVKGLNKTLDYTIDLQVCNREGCSDYSDQLQVYGVRKAPKYVTKSNSILYIAGSVGFVLVMGPIIFISLGVYFRRRRQLSSPLEDISEPNTHDYDDVSTENGYDKLNNDNESLYSIV